MKVIFQNTPGKSSMMQPSITRSNIKGLVNGSGMKSEKPLRGFQNIQKHSQLNGVKSGNAYSISFHTSFSIPTEGHRGGVGGGGGH